MTPQQIAYRQRYLPRQLETARAKVRHLEAECVRLGMPELVGESQ